MDLWREDLAALVPCYDREGGNATLVYTGGGEIMGDWRTVKWNLRRLARHYCVDLEALRRKQAEFLKYTQGLPLPLAPDLVLVPLKTRLAVGKNDGCHSYVNPAAVAGLARADEGVIRSIITLPGERQLPCHYTLRTVQRRLRDGAIALERQRLTLQSGESPGDCKRLLEMLLYTLVTGSRPDEMG